MRLNIDMDGVVCDFNAYIIEHYGRPFDTFPSREMWMSVAADHPHIYRDLKKMPDADELINGINNLAVEYNLHQQMLTAIPSTVAMLHSIDDKQLWMASNYPHLKHDVRFGPYSVNKQWHATAGDVLIDDRVLNIIQWRARGGFGIHHTSASSSLQQLEQYLTEMRELTRGIFSRYPVPSVS